MTKHIACNDVVEGCAFKASAATEDTNAARNARWLQHYGVERGNAGRVFRGEGFVEI